MLITENVINSPSFLFYITQKAGRCETDDLNHSVLFFYFLYFLFSANLSESSQNC